MAFKTPYTDRIAGMVTGAYDPRHVEAYMRIEHSVFDWMAPSRFASEVKIACECIDEGGRRAAERLAASYGL